MSFCKFRHLLLVDLLFDEEEFDVLFDELLFSCEAALTVLFVEEDRLVEGGLIVLDDLELNPEKTDVLLRVVDGCPTLLLTCTLPEFEFLIPVQEFVLALLML